MIVMSKTLLEEGGLVDNYANQIVIDLCHQRRRKKKRKTCNQVLDIKAMSVIQKNIEGKAFAIAIQKWAEQKKIVKIKRVQTALEICNEVNFMYSTNVNEKTVRKYFSTNRMGEVPR